MTSSDHGSIQDGDDSNESGDPYWSLRWQKHDALRNVPGATSSGHDSFFQEVMRQNSQLLRYVGGDDVVFISSIQDYKTYVLSIIRQYDKRSQVFKTIHHALQLVILIGAALVAVLIGIPALPKLIPAILSGVVAAASAIANYYKFGERGRDLRFYAEDMALEYNRFDTKRGLYKGLDVEQARSLFMDRIEDLFYGQRQRTLALEKTQAEQK